MPSAKATVTPPVVATSVPVVVPKPASLTAWLHVENVLSWATMFGRHASDAESEEDAASKEETAKSFMELASVFDFSRPTDGALAVRGKSAYDFAAVLPIRDKDRFLEYLAKDSEVLENKSRYVLKKHKVEAPEPEDDGSPSPSPSPSKKKKKPAQDDPQDEVSCEIGGTPLVAICGNERGLSALGPWLRTGPRPERGDVALELDAAPLRKIVQQELEPSPADGDIVDPSTTPDPSGKSLDDMFKRWTKNALGFASELERVTFYATKKSDDLDFSLAATFVTVESAWVSPLFSKPTEGSHPELLEKLTENASAAVYSQGGGPLADAMSAIGSWTSQPPAEEAKSKALMDELRAISMKPLGAAYGVDLPEVTRALAAYRSTKDPKKAQKSLEKAIDGYGVFAASTDVTSAQRLMKEAARLFEVQEKSTRSGASAPKKKNATSSTFRTASAALGLPRGAFFLDETKTVEEGTGKKKTSKRVTAPEMLVVGEGTFTYFLVGLPDDATFAARAKEIVARKPASGAAKSPYADRKGLLLGGQLTSLVGAFASHEVSLRIDETQSEEARKKLADDLDRDVAAPRLVIPFALTSEQRGSGGRVAFEIRGSSKAFVSLGEHAFSGIGALALIPLMALLHSPTSP